MWSLGALVHKKRAAVVALTAVAKEDQKDLETLSSNFKAQFNEFNENTRAHFSAAARSGSASAMPNCAPNLPSVPRLENALRKASRGKNNNNKYSICVMINIVIDGSGSSAHPPASPSTRPVAS